MAFSELEQKRYESIASKFIDARRPRHEIRDHLDLAFRIENQSVVIFEIRPLWDNPQEKIESMVAKATYVKAQKAWKIYWRRADLKWHLYQPVPQVKTLEEFLEVVDQDSYACFFG